MPKHEMKITAVKARQVLDSRGNPTVEAEVFAGRMVGRASVPSGASTGSHEALELRDGDKRRFHGRGVTKAVHNVNSVIGPRLRGIPCTDQKAIDTMMVELDGTAEKSRLGANAILAVSMATARAAANARRVSLYSQLRAGKGYALPVPMMNVINGGQHAGNELAVQEFLIEPVGAKSCGEGIRMGTEVYQSLKAILTKKYGRGAINVGDEGGFAPQFSKTRDALGAISEAIRDSGHEAEVRIGIDAAASEFYDGKRDKYTLDGTTMGAAKLEDFYAALHDEFALLSIEDPFSEGSAGDFSSITKRLGKTMKIIGDDIYVTDTSRIREGMRARTSNAVLIKLNQVGTVTETEEAIELARGGGWCVAVSHRSGETEDPFIAHLATAFESEFIKTGAPARGERIAKYNELIRIEEELGPRARYSGPKLVR
ncbi:MAG TPA: phosphopyruvate hydratase [Nitrososphaerales archaeon]|nr:phosphopyruvate hydratase [Nitrososphaerales archaeon]